MSQLQTHCTSGVGRRIAAAGKGQFSSMSCWMNLRVNMRILRCVSPRSSARSLETSVILLHCFCFLSFFLGGGGRQEHNFSLFWVCASVCIPPPGSRRKFSCSSAPCCGENLRRCDPSRLTIMLISSPSLDAHFAQRANQRPHSCSRVLRFLHIKRHHHFFDVFLLRINRWVFVELR